MIDGTGRELAFLRQMQEILAHLLVAELIRGLAKELRQLIDLLHVGFLRPLRAAAQDEFLKELLA